ncbi:MAG: OmpA family protein, partial [Deltaproteobacteria bacterium]|nr:OmpA family protein [Deltaproteobacteria bacterium]
AALQAGKAHRQSWTQSAPETTYTARLKIEYGAGKSFDGTMGFTFYCTPRIDVRLAQGGIDLARGRLRLEVSGPAVRAESRVAADSGGELAQQKITLAGGGGKKQLALQWPVDERGFGGLELKLFDKHGGWVQLKLTPFSLEIPHEDVVFENGRWEIRPAEEPKLRDTLAQIHAELERFTDDLSEPTLYIVGYTDTVGSRQDNYSLSANRARSIGHWFREHGLKSPVFFQGFGEEILAVDTPDETPEPANRRASYILTNFPPPIQPGVPRAAWKRL